MPRLIYQPPITAVDIPGSILGARLTGAAMKMCHPNSTRALVLLYGKMHKGYDHLIVPEGSVYVEGYMISSYGIPMEHGWIGRPDGSIIDVTMALPGLDRGRRKAGHRLDDISYYAGPTYTFSQVVEKYEEEAELPFVFWDAYGKKTWGHHSLEYGRAWASSHSDATAGGDRRAFESIFEYQITALLRTHPGLEDRSGLTGKSPLEMLGDQRTGTETEGVPA